MLAYGYTFHMGFLNYYLSLGLAFFGLAIVWRARGSEWLWVLALLALAFVAHPIGFLWLIGAGLYVRSPEFLRGRLRLLAIVVAGIALLGARFYLGKHYETSQPEKSRFFFNGSDQFILFGERYVWLAWAALAFGAACFLKAAISRGSSIYSGRGLRLALELYGIAFLATALLPENIRVPWYAGWIGLLVARLTAISATLGLCILACLRREKWHVAGFGLLALAFFFFLRLSSSRWSIGTPARSTEWKIRPRISCAACLTGGGCWRRSGLPRIREFGLSGTSRTARALAGASATGIMSLPRESFACASGREVLSLRLPRMMPKTWLRESMKCRKRIFPLSKSINATRAT